MGAAKPISDEELISELDSIIAFATSLKQRCYTLKSKLGVSTPGSPKGKTLSTEKTNELIAGLNKSLIKGAHKKTSAANRG